MDTMSWIILSVIVLQAIALFVIRYKFHWINLFKGKDKREDSKIINKFFLGKQDFNENVKELYDSRVKRNKEKRRLLRKKKLEKLNNK